MRVLALHHAGVYVANLERSIAFYQAVFGLAVAERFAFGAEQIAFLAVGTARLELIEASGAPRHTGIVDHVALEVDDLGPLLPHLRAHGVTLLDEVPVSVPELNARILFCTGPDGERIELIDHAQVTVSSRT